MPDPKWKQDEARARLIAAGALALTALIACALIMTAPRAPTAAAPTALSAGNLPRLAADAGLCRAALAEAAVVVETAPEVRAGGCGYAEAVTLTRSLHAFSEPPTTSCALAAALTLWERDVLAPAAERHLGQSVARIELAGAAYSCRPIAGRPDGRLSEHARANAIDIRGFTLADGRMLTVAAGWNGPPQEQAFLRAARDGGCGVFRVTLSPDYNRAHRDHLHFDMGAFALCR